MRRALLLAIIVLTSMGVQPALTQNTPKSARDYYNALRASNTFVRYKDKFVCFSDDDKPAFAIISRGSDIIELMNKAGATPNDEIRRSKDLLFVETYFKGVHNQTLPYLPARNGTDWFIEFTSPLHGKIIYSIDWSSGRYTVSVYALDRSATVPAEQVSGECELIHPARK